MSQPGLNIINRYGLLWKSTHVVLATLKSKILFRCHLRQSHGLPSRTALDDNIPAMELENACNESLSSVSHDLYRFCANPHRSDMVGLHSLASDVVAVILMDLQSSVTLCG